MTAYEERQKTEKLTAMGKSIDYARVYVEEGKYSSAINSIEIAESYAGQLNFDISDLINGTKTEAYRLAVDTNTENAQNSFNAGDIRGASVLIDLTFAYANAGKVSVPEELLTLKARISEIEKAMPIEKTGNPVLDNLFAELAEAK